MTEDSDQGAGTMDAAASPPTAPVADGGPLTVGAIVTVAGVLFLFVVFAVGLVSLQYCINSLDWRRQRAQESPSGRRRRRAGGAVVGRGVDPELLRSLPVTVYSASSGPKDDAVECAVCLAELEDGEEARFLPRCGHGFHAECVDMWLASHTTCPLCRLTVAKPDVPALALALPPAAPEPANYGSSSLPASVLLSVPDRHRGAVNAASPSTDRVPSPAMLVIEIPESGALTPRDVAKSPGLARLMSFRSLWSFGRQGAGPSTSCSCERADLEQGTGIAVAEAQLPSEAYTAGGTRRAGT